MYVIYEGFLLDDASELPGPSHLLLHRVKWLLPVQIAFSTIGLGKRTRLKKMYQKIFDEWWFATDNNAGLFFCMIFIHVKLYNGVITCLHLYKWGLSEPYFLQLGKFERGIHDAVSLGLCVCRNQNQLTQFLFDSISSVGGFCRSVK